MKVKHYYQRLKAQQTATDEDLQKLVCASLVSKILDCFEVSNLNGKMITPDMSVPEMIKSLSGSGYPALYVPYILQNLGIRENDYLKYYYLDVMTNQMYTDLLINMVCTCYKNDVNFIVDFSSSDFEGCIESPSLHVEYQQIQDGGYTISAIVYKHPFNGEMLMEDFESLLTDAFYLLNPEKCFMYLTSKLSAGVSTIPYSQNKEITILPYNGGYYNFEFNKNYRGLAVNYRHNQVLESNSYTREPVFVLETNASARSLVRGEEYIFNVSQLLDRLEG